MNVINFLFIVVSIIHVKNFMFTSKINNVHPPFKFLKQEDSSYTGTFFILPEVLARIAFVVYCFISIPKQYADYSLMTFIPPGAGH